MTQIVLNDQQAKVLAGSAAPVAVCDSEGNILGFVSPGEYEADRQYVERVKTLATVQPRHVERLIREGLDSGESVEMTEGWWEQKRSMLKNHVDEKEKE